MGWRNTPDGELFCICNEFSCRFLLFICKLSFVEMKHMLGKKLKILLAVGAASAVMLAAGCGGGDSKSSSASGKGGIPAVIRVGSETTFPPFEFTEDDKYVGFDLDLADAIIKQMGSKMEFKSMGFDALIPGCPVRTDRHDRCRP